MPIGTPGEVSGNPSDQPAGFTTTSNLPFSVGSLLIPMNVYSVPESYRYELSKLGIDSIIVEPGPFPTDFANKMVYPDDAQKLSEYGELAKIPEKIFGGVVSAMNKVTCILLGE
jgi:hypothetical protein